MATKEKKIKISGSTPEVSPRIGVVNRASLVFVRVVAPFLLGMHIVHCSVPWKFKPPAAREKTYDVPNQEEPISNVDSYKLQTPVYQCLLSLSSSFFPFCLLMIRLNNTQRKRMRSTSPEREGGGDILAHPLPYEGLWFEDGNVVVVAEKSAFKVHLGVLARHSEFFRDMFKLPQATPTCGETMDGLPIIPLPDTETDAVNLLLPMYSCGCRYDETLPQPFASYSQLSLVKISGLTYQYLSPSCFPCYAWGENTKCLGYSKRPSDG